MTERERLEAKLAALKAGRDNIERQFEVNRAAHNGAIQIVEQLLADLSEEPPVVAEAACDEPAEEIAS